MRLMSGLQRARDIEKKSFSDEFAWANFSLNSSKFQSERAEMINA